MNKKTAVLLLAVLLAAGIGGAAVMYNNLKAEHENKGLAAGSAQSSASSEEVRFQPAPDFPFRDGEGNEYHLTDFAGKPTVVNFWTSWCGPCQNEMPHFEEAYTTYGEEINFLMVNLTSYMGDTREKADALIADNGYTFPIYYDTSGNAVSTYGIRGVPMTLFIDADGLLKAYANSSLSADALQTAIDYIYTPE